MNPRILQKLDPRLKAALQYIDRFTNFSLSLQFGRSEAMTKAEDKSVTTISVGVENALSNGRADFFSKRILAAWNKCKDIPGFPSDVELKKGTKGYQLTIKKQKQNGDHHNNTN